MTIVSATVKTQIILESHPTPQVLTFDDEVSILCFCILPVAHVLLCVLSD